MISGAKKLGVRLLVGLLVIAMAAFGLESFLLSGSGQGAMEVNGEEVYQGQIDNAVNNYRNELASSYGQQFVDSLSPEIIAESARGRLIQQILLRQQAEELGLVASDAMVNKLLAEYPSFQVEGAFSIDALQGFLTANRLSLAQFQDNLRTGMGQDLLVQSFASSQAPHTRSLDLIAGLLFVSVDLLHADIHADELARDITPGEDQMADYYADNSNDFVSPAGGSFHYLRLALEDFTAQTDPPDEEAIELAYQDYLAEQAGKEEYEASHILLATGERDSRAAAELARELRERLDAGEDFAALAEEYSDDPGSAKQGGSLGRVALDSLVPEFADQLRLLQPGELSQPVQSDYGYHIIRLDGNPQSNQQTLAEMREELGQQLTRREAQSSYSEAVEQLRNLTQGATSLDAAATTLGLKQATGPLVTRTGLVDSEASSDIFGQPRVREAAFAAQVVDQGLASEVLDLGEEALVLLRDAFTPERQLAMEEVRGRLERETAAWLAMERANALAEAIIELQPPREGGGGWLLSGEWRQELHAQDEAALDESALREVAGTINFSNRDGLRRIADPSDDSGAGPKDDELRSLVFAGNLETGKLMRQEGFGGLKVYMLTGVEQPGYSDLSLEEQRQVRQALLGGGARTLNAQLLAMLQRDADIRERRQP